MIGFFILAFFALLPSILISCCTDKFLRIALLVYSAAYFFTTFLGALLIAQPNNQDTLLLLSTYSIDTLHAYFLHQTVDFNYWILLYAPLIVPVVIILLFNKRLLNKGYSTAFFENFSLPVNITCFMSVFLMVAAYCFYLIYSEYTTASLFSAHNSNNYQAVILWRYQLIQQLGSVFYGLLYIGLPTLSQVALYQAVKTKHRSWIFIFLLSFFSILALVLLTAQKAPFAIYFLSLILGLYILKVIKPWILVVGGLLLAAFITLYQSLILDQWTFMDSLYLMIFRVASSFPFYVNIFPKINSFLGIDYGKSLFSGGSGQYDSTVIVFKQMYPSIEIPGNVAASAHLISYSEAGIGYALFTLVLIGFFILAIAKLTKQKKSPFIYAFYIQGLVFLYYLTQISLRTAIVSCYGYIWVVCVLSLLAFSTVFYRKVAGALKQELSE